MNQDIELNDLMQAIAQKSLRVIANLEKQQQLPALINQFADLIQHFQELLSIFLKNPEKIIEMHGSYWQKALNLTQTVFHSWLENQPLPIPDPRFNSEEWLNNPFFNLLSQHYLLANQQFTSLLEQLEYADKHSAKRIKFFTKQYLDALSPANFIHTNPQIMAETMESSGKNLLQGLHNLLSDLENDSSSLKIKMTDTKAYTVGKNLAITPGKVIFRNAMMELIQYTAQTKQVKSVPLLMIPPWINKYYILDLSQHNSLIHWLVSQGITVFIISWVNPDASFAKKSLFDYLQEGPLTAVTIIKKQLQIKKVNALGFCIGGTLLATLLAYNKAHQDPSIRSATFLASMIDFSDPGDISVFIDEEQIKKLEQEMEVKGYLEGKFMASCFNSLRANDLIWSFFIKNYLRGKNPLPFDILFWNADTTNMPATMHSQYLRWMYLQNDLIKPGKIHLNHTPIDVTVIDTPTFFLSTEKDHIAPWKTTYAGFQLMKGSKRFVLGGSGHIAGIINPPNAQKYSYRSNQHLAATPEEWLAQSTEHLGSWWPEWFQWLKTQSGKAVNPPSAGTAIMDAPGNYVFKK